MNAALPHIAGFASLVFGLLLAVFGGFLLAKTEVYHRFNLRMIGRSWGRKLYEAYIESPVSRVTTKTVGVFAILMGLTISWATGRTLQWW
jgi:hypothetical protein